MLESLNLNPEQLQAVTHKHGPLMILAGAGTGKTKVITSRIAYLLHGGVSARHVVAMTFTNKAAHEMKQRLYAVVGEQQAKGIFIGTFHSYCLQILRRFYKEADLEPRFGIASSGDQLDFVKRALNQLGWDALYRPDELLTQISHCKNHFLSPHNLQTIQGVEDPVVLAKVYDLYERHLKLNRVIDFDDCIFKTATLLQAHEGVRAKIHQEARFLLVDEFQDTNKCQFLFLKLLALDHQNLCVVGDDDQSIYSWRGSQYEIFDLFEETFPGAQVIKLEQNYRCSNVILGAANYLIRHNAKRKDKSLWSVSDVQQPIQCHEAEDGAEEARFVAQRCLSFLGAGHSLQHIAILYRTNTQAKLFEMALREASLNYKTFGGQSFFEKKEVKDFLSYLRLIFSPEDHMAFWRILNTPHRGIGLKSQERIAQVAGQHRVSPFKLLSSDPWPEGLDLSPKSLNALTGFMARMQGFRTRSMASSADLEVLCRDVIRDMGLDQDIKLHSKNALLRQKKLQHLLSLPGWFSEVVSRRQKAGDSIEDILDGFFLNQAFESENGEQTPTISLMSIHAAKGLEFPLVFVCGLEEGFLPHKHSTLGDALSEERRLFYVALTRAKTHLVLTWAHQRKSAFHTEERKPSRFLKELPQDVLQGGLDKVSRQEKPEDRKASTLKKLAELKAMFAAE